MLDQALLVDASGQPVSQPHRTVSRDWDEVQAFCRNAYMPYVVTPLGKGMRPDATMYSANIGRIVATRFSYGVPIHLDRFDPAAGKILVLTTLRGHLRHMLQATTDATTAAGEAFVADCSRTDYWLDGDADHMQFNLTVDHDLMEEMALRQYGYVPEHTLWRSRVKLGDSKRWLALMDYGSLLRGGPATRHEICPAQDSRTAEHADGASRPRIVDPAKSGCSECIARAPLRVWHRSAQGNRQRPGADGPGRC